MEKYHIGSNFYLWADLSEKEIEDAILDALSGKANNPRRRNAEIIDCPYDIFNILAAKCFAKHIDIIRKIYPKSFSVSSEEIVRALFCLPLSDGPVPFHIGSISSDRKAIANIIQNLISERKVKIGIGISYNKQKVWAIVLPDTPYADQGHDTLPPNPSRDDRILEIISRNQYPPGPDNLARLLKEKLPLSEKPPESEIVWLVNRLVRSRRLFFDTGITQRHDHEFSIKVIKNKKKFQSKKRSS